MAISAPIITVHGPLTLVWGDAAELGRAASALRRLLGPLASRPYNRFFMSWGVQVHTPVCGGRNG